MTKQRIAEILSNVKAGTYTEKDVRELAETFISLAQSMDRNIQLTMDVLSQLAEDINRYEAALEYLSRVDGAGFAGYGRGGAGLLAAHVQRYANGVLGREEVN